MNQGHITLRGPDGASAVA